MSLELKGKITGNVRRYVAKADKTNDGKTAIVDINFTLTEAEAQALGGSLFARTCFSDFVGKSGAATVDGKKLGGELRIKAEHTVDVEGYKLSTKPKITDVAISSVDRVVIVTLRLPVVGAMKKLRAMLDSCVGDDIALDFVGVTQPEMLKTDGSDDADEDEGSDDDFDGDDEEAAEAQ
jgi:hypothetical protein